MDALIQHSQALQHKIIASDTLNNSTKQQYKYIRNAVRRDMGIVLADSQMLLNFKQPATPKVKSPLSNIINKIEVYDGRINALNRIQT